LFKIKSFVDLQLTNNSFMKMKPSSWVSLILVCVSFFLLTGCQDSSTQNEKGKGKATEEKSTASSDTLNRGYPKPNQPTTRGGKMVNPDTGVITIGYVNWTEGIAMTHIVEEILEEELNLKVRKQRGYVGQVLDSLAMGTHDIFLDHWLAADSSLDEMADFNDVNINYRNACMGLVVPEYMQVSSIADLKNYKGTEQQIIGIDQGADVMRKTRKAIKAYDLDYELVFSSGPAMIRELQQNIRQKKPVIVTGWRPHWKFGRYDLKFLDDPKKIFGTRKNIHTLTRKGLERDHPKAVAFLKKFQMNTSQLSNLMEVFAQSNNWEKAAEQWCSNHPGLIKQWLPKKPAS
jgi:glycine betaine/proline transport system substrate-binding protein